MLIVFCFGFCSDLIGTSMMFFSAAEKFNFTVHSLSGYLALLIMALHLTWAFLAKMNIGNAERNFTRFSIWAWGIWLLAFFSGIPKG